MGCLSTVLSLNPDDPASLDQTTGATPLPVFRSGCDYRNGLGEMVEVPEAGAIPSARQDAHSLSSAAAPAVVGLDSTTRVHRASFSDSGDGSGIPLLQTESIQLGVLDSALLAEVKDVLIPHERVATHSDRVIGKGMGPGQVVLGQVCNPEMTLAQGTVGQCSALTFF